MSRALDSTEKKYWQYKYKYIKKMYWQYKYKYIQKMYCKYKYKYFQKTSKFVVFSEPTLQCYKMAPERHIDAFQIAL